MNFNDFLNLILPRKNEILRNSLLKNKLISPNGKLYLDVINKFCKILEYELTIVNQLAKISEKLRNCRTFCTIDLFHCIDIENERYLNTYNLKNFMQKRGHELENYEIGDIIFRLCKLNKCNISYEDFQDIFKPIKVLEEESKDLETEVNEKEENYRYVRNSKASYFDFINNEKKNNLEIFYGSNYSKENCNFYFKINKILLNIFFFN